MHKHTAIRGGLVASSPRKILIFRLSQTAPGGFGQNIQHGQYSRGFFMLPDISS